MPDQELRLKFEERFSLEKTHYNQLVIDAQKKMKTRVIHDLRVSLQKLCLFYELTALFLQDKKKERILRKKRKRGRVIIVLRFILKNLSVCYKLSSCYL